MGEYRRLVLLILIMVGVVVIVEAATLGVLYQATLDRERGRLTAIARGQAMLMSAPVANANATPSDSPRETMISRQLVETQRVLREAGIGSTGQLGIARRDGERVVWLTPTRFVADEPAAPSDLPAGQPMQAALDGQSGTMIGTDQHGRRVLAAYEPVAGTGLGLVAAIDMQEINQRYLHAAALAAILALLLAAAAAWLSLRVGRPIVRRMHESEIRYRELFDHLELGVAVYQPVADGTDFVFRDLNRAGELSEGFDRQSVLGRRLTELYPRIREFGLVDVLARVWRTGQPESLPASLYRDETREEWRENHVYRLPGGNIVALFRDVTERKQAEEATKDSEARFSATFENAAVGIANLGLDGTWLRINQQFCLMLGYDRDELLHRKFDDITHPDDQPADQQRFQEMIEGKVEAYSLEKRCFHKDGRVVWINVTNALQRDEHGRPLYIIAVLRDVSLRKQAQDALRESELRMRALLDASRDEILLLSIDGQILAINRAARDRLARSSAGAEPLGAMLDEVLPADQAAQRLATVRRVAETGTMVHYDLRIRSRWFDFWFYPVRRPEGSVQEVAVYAREVTESKRSEADLRKLWQAIEQSPVSVVITDPFGTIEYVNPKFCDATGYAREEAIGENPRVLKSGHTRPEEYTQLWRSITRGHVWRGEFHNRKKNGELFWELASIAPVKDVDGKISHFVGVKEDITERKEIEEQLRQSQKMQALGQLTGGIAHDFNNLLAIIIGNLQLLGERIDGESKLRELFEDALWSANRGAELTHRLLAFARRQPLKPDAVDFNAVIRGLSDLLRRTLGAGIFIREELAPDLWTAYADRGELERALVNLAVNARDAMQSGGVLILETRNATIDETYAQQYEELTAGDYVLLAVNDSGGGMSPEVMRHVFEPFFTTKAVGKGSGLGLSMVYGFVKQSGGHVEIDSRIGQGTTVKLYLPRVRASAGRHELRPADPSIEHLKGRVVLLVEDEPKLRKVAVKMLDKLGLTILQAESAEEALTLLAQRHVDLLFTDIELPGGMNGAELADRALELLPGLKVLFTTGYAREAILADRRSKDDMPWLLKPYSRSDLTRQLIGLLSQTGT